jgi:SAM-dependent methyltransferase
MDEPVFQQESHWLRAVDQKKRIEGSRLLSWINRNIRIRFSVSAQRDRFFLRYIPARRPQQQILDLGCGSGRRYVAERGLVTGVDLTAPLLEEAKTIYEHVYLHDILNMSPIIKDQQFDVVISSDVIGHIPFEEKDRLYAEIARVTKIGGLSVHFIECKHDTPLTNLVQSRWPQVFQKHFIDRVGHIGMETVDQIVGNFKKNGFEVIRLEKLAGWYPNVGFFSDTLNYHDVLPLLPGWLKVVIKCDSLLARNIFLREVLNMLLGPLAWFEGAVTPVHKTTAIMIAARRTK